MVVGEHMDTDILGIRYEYEVKVPQASLKQERKDQCVRLDIGLISYLCFTWQKSFGIFSSGNILWTIRQKSTSKLYMPLQTQTKRQKVLQLNHPRNAFHVNIIWNSESFQRKVLACTSFRGLPLVVLYLFRKQLFLFSNNFSTLVKERLIIKGSKNHCLRYSISKTQFEYLQVHGMLDFHPLLQI